MLCRYGFRDVGGEWKAIFFDALGHEFVDAGLEKGTSPFASLRQMRRASVPYR